ncbi:hypothetical protein BCR33DRAFT_712864 [Rhizoclosmatium globosum]|uniref:Uncharacterized protein n=1 Tax=Rhizoclosmatium globosum TaxID=329046 RepID=A0A1Y2CV12_9FUNG|nr:hypothetical protein BCR33DRAFT_712864 [Rhizoclosmatium globosum]|eukprot:ORY50900.1 hypothetical protein BCR33DRAFT_712864 [Rhizoclosmatium globosum]
MSLAEARSGSLLPLQTTSSFRHGSDTDTESDAEAVLSQPPKRKRGRPRLSQTLLPPTSTSKRAKPTGKALQIVGEGDVPAFDSLPPSLSVELGLLDGDVNPTIPTMTVAAYAHLVGRNKAADELQLNRPMVGRWMKLYKPENPVSQPIDCLSNTPTRHNAPSQAIAAELAHRVIAPKVVLPDGLKLVSSSNSKQVKKMIQRERRRGTTRINTGDNITMSRESLGSDDFNGTADVETDAGSSSLDRSQEEEGETTNPDASDSGSDDEFMNDYLNVEGDGGMSGSNENSTSFETAFAAIREAARVAIAGARQ